MLVALEPTLDAVRAHAAALAASYNEPYNRAMMGHTGEFSESDVVAHYEMMEEEGARQFFLYRGEAFAGDADFRHIAGGRGEFAILIAARAAQGKGLGTRFAIMLHVLAFRAMGLERVYVTILPENLASLRLFEKIGYALDDGPEARSYVDEERDVSMSIGKRDFERAHLAVLGEIRVREL